MSQNYDAFISYRRSDGTDLALAVRNYLKSRGLRVFLDTKELVDGKYFDEQIRQYVLETPNYILIATPDAFKFRPETENDKDWLLEEMRLAVGEFDKDPEQRTVISFVPNITTYPTAEDLPKELVKLPRLNRIELKSTMPTDTELLRLAKAVCNVTRRNMWDAGQRFLEKSTEEGKRFHSMWTSALCPSTGRTTSVQMPVARRFP